MDRKLSANELKGLLAGGAKVTLVDARRAEDREADPQAIPGAIWRDRDQVETWAHELPRDRPVVAYCMHGRTGSAGVVDRLRELGFEAALLEGGFEGWKAAGGQLVPAGEGVSTSGAPVPRTRTRRSTRPRKRASRRAIRRRTRQSPAPGRPERE